MSGASAHPTQSHQGYGFSNTYKKGGLPREINFDPVTLALDALKVLQFADNPTHGYWNILSIDEMIARFERFHTMTHATNIRK